MKVAVSVIMLLAAVLAPVSAADADPAKSSWPNFRGPSFSGEAPGSDPPIGWSETKNIRWKVPLEGSGHASPVVWGSRIYVLSALKTNRVVEKPEGADTGHPDARPGRPPRKKPTHVHQFIASAFDLASGERVWRTVLEEAVPHESLHATASQASASPVTDGENVWAFFGSRGLYCLDKTGKVVWRTDLGTQRTRNEFGEGSSPVLVGDLVVVNWDHEGDSLIVALDKKTGAEQWRVSRDEPTSWSTPLVVRDGERQLIVVSATNAVRAYDPHDGSVVWQASGLGLNVVPTPVSDGETIWAMSGWREAHGIAIRFRGANGDLTGTDRIVWQTERGLSYVPSPVLIDGRIYFFQRFSGILSCYRLASGEACYDQQRIENFEDIYASPVAAGGRIYSVSRDGKAIVLRAGDRFEVLATNQLDDSFNATPAVIGDTIILRGDEFLYRIGKD